MENLEKLKNIYFYMSVDDRAALTAVNVSLEDQIDGGSQRITSCFQQKRVVGSEEIFYSRVFDENLPIINAEVNNFHWPKSSKVRMLSRGLWGEFRLEWGHTLHTTWTVTLTGLGRTTNREGRPYKGSPGGGWTDCKGG